MAALGQIRKKGAFLVIVIGLALFAFVAEEAFRSCETTRNQSRQQVAEINGKKFNVQDFQALVDEYSEVVKMTTGRENLGDEELTSIKDQVWQSLLQEELLKKETEKLGLKVTDQELQNVISEGKNQMLMNTPFVNQETGRFDYSALQKFISEYKKMDRNANPQMTEQYDRIYKYWQFVEKTMRTQILNEKYQGLLAHCFISNPVAAKQNFNNKNEESDITLAAFPYSSVADKDVKVDDADFQKKYDELKEAFKMPVETRDIKYVSYKVNASPADRQAIKTDIDSVAKTLAAATDATEAVRKANSSVAYLGVPVTSKAFPTDIAAKIDSLSTGAFVGPFENTQDNTINIIKVYSKQELPDSIEFRAIQVGAETVEACRVKADSIAKALREGADFETLAKKYQQTGTKNWMTTSQYEMAPSMDKDTKAYINTLNTAAVNEINNVEFTNGNIILQVTDRRNMVAKYDAAIVKRSFDFSKETYSAAYNKFSQMVSASNDITSLEANAKKFGFTVQTENQIANTAHAVASLKQTREALKWIFQAEEGQVSPLYECGNNDNLLVCVLNKVHPEGYPKLDDVKEQIKVLVINDKKAEMLMKKVEGVKNINDAKAKGAQVSDLAQVTFNAPAFVAASGAAEPALSGAVAGTAKGKFSSHAVKGNSGVYLFQVKNKKQNAAKFDAKAEEKECSQKAMQAAGRFMNDLLLSSKIKDNRYLFF
ncbi:MAG: SurA N-terminal domain-containing protein [Prevotellaceae bacterium]|nr:SurA N-terminal domain-containing protein [Prevotellaceae bacterium]